MSKRETLEIVHTLNGSLETLYQGGTPLMLDMDGKPDLRIDSFMPLIYEPYNRFRNRAPRITGSIALRGFLTAPSLSDPEGTFMWAGVEAGKNAYGIALHELDLVVNIGRRLGYSVSGSTWQ